MVFLEVDFPRTKVLDPAVREQNESLKKMTGVGGYPTFMLCDAEGRPYSTVAYPEDLTPDGMIEELEKSLGTKSKRDELFAEADKAEGVEKAKILVEALGAVPEESVIGSYAGVIEKIAKLDPEDETGFVKEALAAREVYLLKGDFTELMKAKKFDAAEDLVTSFLEVNELEGELKQQAVFLQMLALANGRKFDEAIQLADEIIKIAPESDVSSTVKQIKEQLKAEIK